VYKIGEKENFFLRIFLDSRREYICFCVHSVLFPFRLLDKLKFDDGEKITYKKVVATSRKGQRSRHKKKLVSCRKRCENVESCEVTKKYWASHITIFLFHYKKKT
jgi:hypothetical protein